MTIFCTRKNYEGRCVAFQYTPDLYSVELSQRWPEAKHAHWRRIGQLNLTKAELTTLVEILHEALNPH